MPRKGQRMSEEQKRKIGAANTVALKGRTLTPEHRVAISQSLVGLRRGEVRTPEQREKISVSCRGRVPWNKGLTGITTPKPEGWGLRANAWMLATPRTEEQRERHRRALQAHAETSNPNCGCAIHTQPTRSLTRPHRILLRLLTQAGYVVEIERRFGRALVDCYLPDYHLAFEADGTYWHRAELQARDRARDERLWERFRLPVVRLTQAELEEVTAQWD